MQRCKIFNSSPISKAPLHDPAAGDGGHGNETDKLNHTSPSPSVEIKKSPTQSV